MKHVHFFQWNIPADNQFNGETNRFINVVAEWNGDGFYSDGRPMVYVNPVNMNFWDAIQVKDWMKANNDIKKLAESHFAELARQERINQARAVLQVEENPVMERLNHSGLFDTISVGGVEYSTHATLNDLPVIILSAFGSANQKCKIKDWLNNEKIVETQDLKLTEMSTA